VDLTHAVLEWSSKIDLTISGLLTNTSHSQMSIKEDTETLFVHRSQHHYIPRLQAMVIMIAVGISAISNANQFTLFFARGKSLHQ